MPKFLFVLCLGVLFCSCGIRSVLAQSVRPAMAITVDLQKLPRRAFRRYRMLMLHRKILERLLQADFSILPPHRKSTLRLRFLSSSKGLQIEVLAGKQRVTRLVRQTGEEMSVFHLEVLHKCLMLVRFVRLRYWMSHRRSPKMQKRPPPPNKRPSERRPVVRQQTKKVVSIPSVPNPWFVSFDVGPSLVIRSPGVDVQGRVGVRVGQRRGFGLYASGFLTPFLSDSITIMEWGVQLGPTWRQNLTNLFSLEFGLLCGWLQHLYFFRLGQDGQRERIDFVGNLWFSACFHATKKIGFSLWFSPGMTTKGRVHRLDGVIIWERSLFRLDMGVSVVLSV